MAGHMTGLSAPMLILVKKLAGETRGSTTIRALHAPIFARGTARRVMHASLHMVCLSVGFTRLVIGLNHARMGRVAGEGCVSLLTHQNNCEFCLSIVLEALTRLILMMGLP